MVKNLGILDDQGNISEVLDCTDASVFVLVCSRRAGNGHPILSQLPEPEPRVCCVHNESNRHRHHSSGLRLYTCLYRYQGEQAEVQIEARNREEAAERIQALAQTGEIKGFLVEEKGVESC